MTTNRRGFESPYSNEFGPDTREYWLNLLQDECNARGFAAQSAAFSVLARKVQAHIPPTSALSLALELIDTAHPRPQDTIPVKPEFIRALLDYTDYTPPSDLSIASAPCEPPAPPVIPVVGEPESPFVLPALSELDSF